MVLKRKNGTGNFLGLLTVMMSHFRGYQSTDFLSYFHRYDGSKMVTVIVQLLCHHGSLLLLLGREEKKKIKTKN